MNKVAISTAQVPITTSQLQTECSAVERTAAETQLTQTGGFNGSTSGHGDEGATSDTAEGTPYLLTPDRLKVRLRQSVFGAKLLEKADDLKLSSEGQKFVTDVVAKYHLSSGRKTSSQQLGEYAAIIGHVFRKEEKV